MIQPATQVVAIGASAGGIEAFRQFFEHMPAPSGLAFVVVLHLPADRKSLLADIISRWTTMGVSHATDGEPVRPDHVHVIPPGVVATLADGTLRLRQLSPDVPREATPIDTFFDSVAQDLGDRSIGIVLSGTGHDGALGLKAIKGRGGLTLAQGTDGTAPQQPGMPNSAIATGAVDLVVPANEMGAQLMAAQRPAAQSAPVEEVAAVRRRICETLRERVGHDFSQYKDKTFLRRVERRMQVLGIARLDDYADRIAADHDEAVRLFRDLLIGVTQFFRDAGAFEAVERLVIPRLFHGKGKSDTVRVWVPGCATGEEAYSLAILLRERMDAMKAPPRVQVFATDIDEPAIATARSGRYPAGLLDGLSAERRERFFTRTEGSFLATKAIRDLCTFSTHSVVRDPPFSRLDMVSCRNLLIYMDVELQGAVVPTFHYALSPGGVLLLGSAETVVRHDALFAPLDKDHRIFVRRDGPSPLLRLQVGPTRPYSIQSLQPETEGKREGPTDRTRSLARASARVLERYAAPYAVVTGEGEVLHYSSRSGNHLLPALGPPSRSIFDMARRGLQLGLRTTLRAAVASGAPSQQHLMLESDGGTAQALTLIVEPLPGSEQDRLYLVIFSEAAETAGAVTQDVNEESLGLLVQMEREMRDAREQVQSLA